MAKRKHSTLDEKINKIGNALSVMEIEMSDKQEKFVREVIESSCGVTGELVDEVENHPGVYAYYAEQRAALKNILVDSEAKLRISEDELGGCILNAVIDITKTEFEGKLADHNKKDIIALLSSSVENVENYAEKINIREYESKIKSQIEERNKRRRIVNKTKKRINILDPIVDCLGYQKNMTLKALADLHVSGIRQER